MSTLSLTPGSNVDFFAVLISDTQFASSEGIPGPQLINNPGFDNLANGGGPVTWPNFDRFTIASVPESSALLTIPVALLRYRASVPELVLPFTQTVLKPIEARRT